MPTVRPILCVLLAVSTAPGTAPIAAKACGCKVVSVKADAPVRAATCCVRATVKTACCKAAACCEATPASVCSGHCDCGTLTSRPADSTPAVPMAETVSAELVATAPTPPTYLPLPTADRPLACGVASLPPPLDLVTTLARLTC